MTDRRPRAEIAAAARDYGNLFCIWRLCGKTACLRAQRCRGDGLDCFRRCVPTLPEPVRAFLAGLDAAQKAGLTWEEALDDLWEEWRAVREWNEVVANSLAPTAGAENAASDDRPLSRSGTTFGHWSTTAAPASQATRTCPAASLTQSSPEQW